MSARRSTSSRSSAGSSSTAAIYSFHRGDEHVYYIGSADLMPRNLDTRVELLVPIERPELQAEIQDTLDRCLADDTYSWTMASGRDSGPGGAAGTRSVHNELMERTLAMGRERRQLIARCTATSCS